MESERSSLFALDFPSFALENPRYFDCEKFAINIGEAVSQWPLDADFNGF